MSKLVLRVCATSTSPCIWIQICSAFVYFLIVIELSSLGTWIGLESYLVEPADGWKAVEGVHCSWLFQRDSRVQIRSPQQSIQEEKSTLYLFGNIKKLRESLLFTRSPCDTQMSLSSSFMNSLTASAPSITASAGRIPS